MAPAVPVTCASISPLPYKVFTLSAGLFSVDLVTFIFASLVGRGIRFFVVSYVADRYGIRAKKFIIEQQKMTAWILAVLVVCAGIYLVLKNQGIL